MIALAGGVLTIVGVFGPWVTTSAAIGLTATGISLGPGILALLFAIVSMATLAFVSKPAIKTWVPVGLMSVAAVIALLNIVTAQAVPQGAAVLQSGLVAFGWGIYLTIVGALVTVVFAVVGSKW